MKIVVHYLSTLHTGNALIRASFARMRTVNLRLIRTCLSQVEVIDTACLRVALPSTRACRQSAEF